MSLLCLKRVAATGFFIILVCPPASAETGVGHAKIEYEATSDQLFRSGYFIDYRNHRRELLYPYPDEAEEAQDWGVGLLHTRGQTLTESFCGTRLSLLYAKKFSSRYQLDLVLGAHNLRPQVSESKLMGIFESTLWYLPTPNWGGALRLGRDYLYQNMLLPGGVLNALTASYLETRGFAKAADRWRVPYFLSYKMYSDDNRRQEYDLGIMYGISPGVPWIWAGIGTNQIRHSQVVSGYYSPTYLFGYGPRLDANIELFSEWSLAAAINLNRSFDQDSQTWSQGHYAAVRLQQGRRDAAKLALEFTSINSARQASFWGSSAVALHYSSPL